MSVTRATESLAARGPPAVELARMLVDEREGVSGGPAAGELARMLADEREGVNGGPAEGAARVDGPLSWLLSSFHCLSLCEAAGTAII